MRRTAGREFVPCGAIAVDSGTRPTGLTYNPTRQLLAWAETPSSASIYLANLAAPRRRIELRSDVPGLVRFRFSEVLAIAVLLGTLERRDGLVVPGPLQIGVPPWRLRDGCRRGCSGSGRATGRASGRRLGKQMIGRGDRGEKKSGQDDRSHSHGWLLRNSPSTRTERPT